MKVEVSSSKNNDDSSEIFEYNDDASFASASTKFSTDTHPRVDSKTVLKTSRPPFNPVSVMHGIINSNEILCKVSEEAVGGSGGFFSSGMYGTVQSSKASEKKAAFFKKICALCNLQFPKDAISSSVIYKHIVDLRRRWDPSLVSEKIQIIEQNMSMYNLVPVCLFCSQYFDPEVPDGISMPNQQLPSQKKTMLEKLQTTSKDILGNLEDSSLSDTSSSSRTGSPAARTIMLSNLSRRGTVLTPIRVSKSRQNSSQVHLIAGMDTRFEIGNNLERLSSPEVRERRDHAKILVEFEHDLEKFALAKEEAKKHRIMSAPQQKDSL